MEHRVSPTCKSSHHKIDAELEGLHGVGKRPFRPGRNPLLGLCAGKTTQGSDFATPLVEELPVRVGAEEAETDLREHLCGRRNQMLHSVSRKIRKYEGPAQQSA